jgi:hypothetical protein
MQTLWIEDSTNEKLRRSTPAGIQLEASDEQPDTRLKPIVDRRESGSNATVDNIPQPPKHRSPIVSSDEGRQIDFNDLQKRKAHVARTETQLSDSNVTRDRAQQQAKQEPEIFSTVDGIQIALRDSHD